MPIKIYKSNSRQAQQVRIYHFGQSPEGVQAEVDEIPDWMLEQERAGKLSQPSPEEVPDPVPAEPVEPPPPAVDLASIEKSAYESGFSQGEKTGMALAEKKVEAGMRRYAEAIFEIAKVKPRLYREVEHDVVRLALEVAKKIVHREIQMDEEIIQTMVRVALGNVAEKSAVTVHLNPGDYNYMLEHRAALAQSDPGREIMLLADKSVDRGGCVIQTECGDIDARIEEQFREVERTFFERAK